MTPRLRPEDFVKRVLLARKPSRRLEDHPDRPVLEDDYPEVQPDTGVDKLCLINTIYPHPYPAGPGWIRSLPRTKAPLLFPMFWLQEAKEHVPRQHCLALAAEAAGAQAFDAAQVVGHFAAVSERSPFGFILTRKHCAARSDGSKLPVPSQDRRH